MSEGILLTTGVVRRIDSAVQRVESMPDHREAGGFDPRFGGEEHSDEAPDVIGSSEETEAAETDEWDAEDEEASPNVDVVMQTRTAYNHAGDKKLYAYYRTFSYVCGRLVKISAETRVEIDAPEDC